MKHIGHVVKMSAYGYSTGWFKHQLHQYIVTLSKTLNPHCFSQLSGEMGSSRGDPREGRLYSAIKN